MKVRPIGAHCIIRRLPLMLGKQSSKSRLITPDNLDSRNDTHRMADGLAVVVEVGPGEWHYAKKLREDVRDRVPIRVGDVVVVDNILMIGAWPNVSDVYDDGHEYYAARAHQLLGVVEDEALLARIRQVAA